MGPRTHELPTNNLLPAPSASSSERVPAEDDSGLNNTDIRERISAATPAHAPPKMVYLFTFPPVPHVYNISPFSLKVESFIRLHNIPYEVVPTFAFSSKGQMPYIRLNSKDGEEVPDSNVIIKRLRAEFGIDGDSNADAALTDAERAVAHAVTRMIEEHTTQIGFYFRYTLNMTEFIRGLDIDNRMFNTDNSIEGWMMSLVFARIMPFALKNRLKYSSLGRHSHEELWAFSNDDIQAISDYLADKPFFFGDVATTIDCILFGHLVQFLDVPLNFPQKRYMNEHCQNVVQLVERFKAKYWKDWDEKCLQRARVLNGQLAERFKSLYQQTWEERRGIGSDSSDDAEKSRAAGKFMKRNYLLAAVAGLVAAICASTLSQ